MSIFDQFEFSFDNFEHLNNFAILAITKTILETYDIWDTDYNSDNWEPEFRQSLLPDH